MPQRPTCVGSASSPDSCMRRISRVFHLVEAANWPAVREQGLRCADSLIARAIDSPDLRHRLTHGQRTEHLVLPDGTQLRDQRPMPAPALARCLIGIEPAHWYALINAHVYFWLDPARLDRQRKACQGRPQVVLTVDATTLIRAHADRAFVTPINSGNARRRPALRGASSFVPIARWIATGWQHEAQALGMPERAASHVPVELAIRGDVPDLMQHVVASRTLVAGQSFAAI